MKTTTYSRDEMVAELASLAERLDQRSVSKKTWLRETGISERKVLDHFDLWNDFVIAAELMPNDGSRIDDDTLLAALRDALIEAGGVKAARRVEKFCRYNLKTYSKRWGHWQHVLACLREWAEAHDPDFLYMADLPGDEPAPAIPPARSAPLQQKSRWVSNAKTQYGPFLNFRGLQHAPISETGVVLLFGMVAKDLDFRVEGVREGYPDCQAKRRIISKKGEVWEPVLIEFEFRSHNFHEHCHDPDGCDLIVCWEHNWPECPLEVLELRTAIADLAE
jgi:hypothetical protein